MKKAKIFIPVIILVFALWYFWPMTAEKALAKQGFDTENIDCATYTPIDFDKDLEIIEFEKGNQELADYFKTLKVRRTLPKNRDGGMYFYHDGYTFYWNDGVVERTVKLVLEEWLVVDGTYYKIV